MSDKHTEGGAPSPAGKIVLLVEDNLHNRKIFSSMLTHKGYVVKEALDGNQAVEMAVSEPPDIILMDLSLPVMDGWEATRQIKNNAQLKHIPILALTAHAMAGDEEQALEAGCDGYLTKPISPSKVVEEVEKVLRGR